MTRKKILIVDDDPALRQGYQIRLNANGYDTFFATDAVDGLAAARKHTPDLIILDLGLPAGDGFVVMDRLSKFTALSLIPILVVSARDRLTMEARVLKAGAKAFLQKPVENSLLLSEIRTILDGPISRSMN